MERAMEMAGATLRRCTDRRAGGQALYPHGNARLTSIPARAFEAEAFGVTCGTADKDEGMSAFLEKRTEKQFYQPLSCTAGRLYGVRTERRPYLPAACRAGRTGEGPAGYVRRVWDQLNFWEDLL